MFEPSAHQDTFARDHLPPRELWPEMDWAATPELAAYPARMNCAAALLDAQVQAGRGTRPCCHFAGTVWTYGDMLATANRYAHVLVDDLGVVPGNRILLRAPNNPQALAVWFAILKVGAVAVATMPLLRARELGHICNRARVVFAIHDSRLSDELHKAKALTPQLTSILDTAELGTLSRSKPETFNNVDAAADDVALIAFTSGTTGPAKGCMHFHRDVLAICDTFSRRVLQPNEDDVFCGTQPIAFTFGLGVLVAFPFHVGASVALIEQPSPEALLQTIAETGATICATAPIAYRAMADMAAGYDLSSLRACISAGETLPLAIYQAWEAATGIRTIDGLGATEMLHIFISAAGDDIRPGTTGRAVPGFKARVVDEAGRDVPADTVGRLAVRGPTGCRYLDDIERQKAYVQDGWNLTGDSYRRDAEGYYWFQARTDDMIVAAGYNVSGPEVEGVLLEHAAVAECAVVGCPDAERGTVVKAFIKLREGVAESPALVEELQDFVKAEIAPYKYPRAIEFVAALPRTETGKLQRYKLREQERSGAG